MNIDPKKAVLTQVPRKKILFLITKSVWGGAQRYVFDLASAFRHEYEVSIATGETGTLTEKVSELEIPVRFIKSFQRDISIKKELYSLWEIFLLLKDERPDVIHVNSSKAGGLGALAARIANIISRNHTITIIFTAHGWAFKESRSRFENLAIRFFSLITVLLSDFTITVSEDDHFRARWMPFAQKKMVAIHNGIGTLGLKKRKDARHCISQALGATLPQSNHWIGTIAELHKNKGLEYVLEAIRILAREAKDFLFVIIGEGEDRKRLEDCIERYELKEVVHLTGRLPDASKLLSAFDVFTLSSIKEGLPYTILEAGRAGLPVVATSVGGIPEIIEDMRSGILVRPKNPTELAGALKLFIDDKKRREEFGAALKETITTRFSKEKMLEETRHIYAEALQEKS